MLPRVVAAALLASIAAASCPAPAAADSAQGVVRYAAVLREANGSMTLEQRRDLADRILHLCSYYHLDPHLLAALVSAESSWHSHVVSPAGALGYGQLMPGTAAGLGVDPMEPIENLDGTARYLRRLLNRFASPDVVTEYRLAVAAYNAGPAAVLRYRGVPPYAETQHYVTTVLGLWERFRSSRFVPPAPAVVAGAIVRPPQRKTPVVQTLAYHVASSHRLAPARQAVVERHDEFAANIAAAPIITVAPNAARRVAFLPNLTVVPRRSDRRHVEFAPSAPPMPIVAVAVKAEPRAAFVPNLTVVPHDAPQGAPHVSVAHHTSKRAARDLALRAPSQVMEGYDIPVEVKASGLRSIVIMAKVGPQTIDRRVVRMPVRRVMLKAPPVTHDSRIVMVRAFAPGVPMRETMVVTVPERPGAVQSTSYLPPGPSDL